MKKTEPILISPNATNLTQSVSFTFRGAIHLSILNSNKTFNVNEKSWKKWCFDWPQEASSFMLIALSSYVGIRTIAENTNSCADVNFGKCVLADISVAL